MSRFVVRGLVRAIVAATAVVVIVSASHTSVKTTSLLANQASARAWTTRYDQLTCLEAAFRHAVPEGARVYMEAPNSDDFWILTVSTAQWAQATAKAAVAQWTVTVKQVPKGCDGIQLVAVRR